MFFQDGFKFINPIGRDKDYPFKSKYPEAFKYFIIPIYSLLWFIAELHVALFYKIRLKKDKVSEDGYANYYEDFM